MVTDFSAIFLTIDVKPIIAHSILNELPNFWAVSQPNRQATSKMGDLTVLARDMSCSWVATQIPNLHFSLYSVQLQCFHSVSFIKDNPSMLLSGIISSWSGCRFLLHASRMSYIILYSAFCPSPIPLLLPNFRKCLHSLKISYSLPNFTFLGLIKAIVWCYNKVHQNNRFSNFHHSFIEFCSFIKIV